MSKVCIHMYNNNNHVVQFMWRTCPLYFIILLHFTTLLEIVVLHINNYLILSYNSEI